MTAPAPSRWRFRRRLATLVVTSAAVGVSASATRDVLAQDAQTQAMGRALFNDGMTLFTAGRYAEACPKFEASYKAFPGLGTRGKLAECYEKMGRYASAWATYREVAQTATRLGDVTREQVASERAKALEPRLSYITVVLAPGADVPGLLIRENNEEVPASKLGAAEPVDPGTLSFEVRAPGRKPFAAEVTVTAGQTARFEVPALELEGTPDSGPRAPTPLPPTPLGDPATTYPAADNEGSSWQKTTGYVLGAGGIVALGVGSYFGLAARSNYNGAFDSGACDPVSKLCSAEGQQQVDDARSRATASTVLFIVGGAALAGGAALVLFSPKHHRVAVTPAPLSGGAAVLVSGSWF